MDYYKKGANEEELLEKGTIPIKHLPEQFAWYEVVGSTNIKTCVGQLHTMLSRDQVLVVSGSGPSTAKVVTLTEIFKRKYRLDPATIEIGERVVREYWEPKHEYEELDTLVVTRKIPTIHVMFKKKPKSSSKKNEPKKPNENVI